MENPNPQVFQVDNTTSFENFVYEPARPLIPENIYNLIRKINDPEHPMSLEELGVVQMAHIEVNEADKSIAVLFTPTIPHCSMATLIGLCIKIKIRQSLPADFWIDVKIREGSHVSEQAINKQLADKERVAAALENPSLSSVVKLCLDGPAQPGIVHMATA